MAGEPGSGKSTLARAIGEATGAVVIDKDVIKSAALNAGAAESLAAGLAYEAMFDLARSLLDMGHSVILDSPAFFTDIRAKGRAIAAAVGVAYRLIETICDDAATIEARLSGRQGLRSQPRARITKAYERPGTALLDEPRLTIDARGPLCDGLRRALEYLRS
jgi:predicted kinase